MDYYSAENKIEEWDENIEKILEEQKYKCYLYKTLHEKESNRLDFISKSLNGTNIVIVTFIATGTAVTNDPIFNNTTWSPIVNIVYSILLFSSAIISSTQQYYNFEKNSEKNRLASLKFQTLFNNIKRMLSLDKKYRHNAGNYFSMINREYDSVFLNSPDISESIMKRYKEIMTINEICNFRGPSHNIDVHSQEENTKMKHEIEGFFLNNNCQHPQNHENHSENTNNNS